MPPFDHASGSDYSRVSAQIRSVTAKHNQSHGYIEADESFYYLTGDCRWEDRTMELAAYGFAEWTPELVTDLQAILRRKRFWRIALLAETLDDHILVYPYCVRNNDASSGESLAETLARVNEHLTRETCRYQRYACVSRPGFKQSDLPPRLGEAKVIYNSERNESFPDWPVFCTEPNLFEPSVEEYLAVEKELVAALVPWGPIVVKNNLSDTGKERLNALWLIRTTAVRWDRTRVLVKYGSRQFAPELIRDIQDVLQRWPLWRIALDAEDESEVRFVYPHLVR